ncbi:uncharacterized protein VTP21DRAFT_7095 [Calcarisporiella thermophila]|uniref:uncharacterized protein n=1 Tax=Calcarisporiella thermophila TaxID=911321 RepID=UPI0037433428
MEKFEDNRLAPISDEKPSCHLASANNTRNAPYSMEERSKLCDESNTLSKFYSQPKHSSRIFPSIFRATGQTRKRSRLLKRLSTIQILRFIQLLIAIFAVGFIGGAFGNIQSFLAGLAGASNWGNYVPRFPWPPALVVLLIASVMALWLSLFNSCLFGPSNPKWSPLMSSLVANIALALSLLGASIASVIQPPLPANFVPGLEEPKSVFECGWVRGGGYAAQSAPFGPENFPWVGFLQKACENGRGGVIFGFIQCVLWLASFAYLVLRRVRAKRQAKNAP